MKAWKKGAIVGAVWGIIGIFFYIVADMLNISPNKGIESIIFSILGWIFVGIPFKIAVYLGFGFYYVFIGAVLVCILIGIFVGYLYEKYKGARK